MEITRARFAPSPTGSLHIGGARTALFNYLVAKKSGGCFLLRIEDTDRARHMEDAVQQITRDLKWLGIEWDEGVGRGGDFGPYRQSERLEIYSGHIEKLLDSGQAYYAFDTPEELDAMRTAAQERRENFRYPRPDTFPTGDQAESATAEGRPVVVRIVNPGKDISITDEVFGEVTIPADQTDDFIIRKADGWPTYHLANVVDDGLMGVDFICRGQEFLGQTWRHVILREALGLPEPKYAHLPLIMDAQGKKLSKRDGDVEVDQFRRAGYLPEALVNFIALLGWNPGDDRENFSLSELVEAFDLSGIGKSNPKFDRDKLMAFNTDHAAAADNSRLLACFIDYLSVAETSIPTDDEGLLDRVLKLSEGFRTFEDVVNKCEALFVEDDSIEYETKAVKKVLKKNEGEGYSVLESIIPELEELDWTVEAMETWMRGYCDENQLGMGKIAQPLRVAVTGTTISPQIFDTLEILGKDSTIDRIRRCMNNR